jgi:hypothetical protein
VTANTWAPANPLKSRYHNRKVANFRPLTYPWGGMSSCLSGLARVHACDLVVVFNRVLSAQLRFRRLGPTSRKVLLQNTKVSLAIYETLMRLREESPVSRNDHIPPIYNISSSLPDAQKSLLPKLFPSKTLYLGLVTLLSAALGSSTIFSTALASLLASFFATSSAESFFWLALYIRTRVVWVAPTQKSRKLTEARNRLRGLMMKHQRVQIRPVQVRAAFWESERSFAGRAKSAAPARTRPHCEEEVC